jgi:copper chaperone CopZ
VETYSLEVPMLYGDHHVLEVRRILLELPGVAEVYASSAFKMVEVRYDTAMLDADAIRAALEQAGYLGELEISAESGEYIGKADDPGVFMRHTDVTTQIKDAVSFTQQVPYHGRPLWPCPGMGILEEEDKELSHA